MGIGRKIAGAGAVCLVLLLNTLAWSDEAATKKEKWVEYQTQKELQGGISQENPEANDPNAAAMAEHIRGTERKPGELQKVLDQNQELLRQWGMQHRNDPQFDVFRKTGKAVD